jgi:hypothetical protein
VILLFVAILGLLLVAAWIAPLAGDRWIRPIEQACAVFARKRSLVLVTLGLLTIVARLALLPILPIPAPAIHDEFSYLLGADTFAHGRLTNPPHPFSVFFDTFHELQHPTYASKYPPGPAAVMALGQVLGHPWIGVLLSTAAMVVSMTWMLQGWFSAPWALVGGLLVWAHFGVFAPWVDSYYNGSVATVGAALVFGAYPRILHFGRARDAFLLGIGAVILADSRPVEGFIFCVPIAIALSARLVSSRLSDPHLSVRRFFLPIAAILIPAGLFLAYYNFRVTGNALLFPYVLYHREYFNNYPVFTWQKQVPPLHYANLQFEIFFNDWNRNAFDPSWTAWTKRAQLASWELWLILLGPALTLPLVMLARVVRDRRMRLPLWEIFICGIGLLSVIWFQPHYAAPMAAAVFVVVVQATRHLRRAKIHGRPIGIFLSRLIVVLVVDWVAIQAGHAARYPVTALKDQRGQVLQTLESVPGKHLVVVRYAPTHDVHREWVYNAADIDSSRIVWVREIPRQDITPLLRYYHDRKVWLLEADQSPPTLEPYPRTSATEPRSVP